METLNVYAAIIGGGASALVCGCVAGKNNPDKKIVILERDNRVGKKILVSGNSRCNMTNLCADISKYHTSFDEGLQNLLANYSPKKVIEYFESIGLVTMTDSESRVYPLSRQASAVLSVLRNELKRHNVQEICDTEVTSIEKTKDGYKLSCSNMTVFAKKVVVATGGKNNYAQKVVNNPYIAAQSIGHKITALSPSLSPVMVKSKVINSLKGIRALCKVSAIVDNKNVKSEYGEIQFSTNCLSGICVFNISKLLNTADNGEIEVKLLPDYSFVEIKDMLKSRIKLNKNENVQELFTGLFHKNIGVALLKESKIDTSKKASDLSGSEINSLANTINSWRFKTVKSSDFNSAQVTSGGIIGSQIDPKTLESKIAKDVYLCGEVIDVDGDCGGFNLQFAFSSGMCVGEQL